MSSATSFFSFKAQRSAPASSLPEKPLPLRRMASESFIPKIGTRERRVGQLTYDHFAFHHPEVPVRTGYVGVQRDKLRSWSWTRRLWLVLHDSWLDICQREDADASDRIALHRVRDLERVETKRFCLMLATSSQTWYLLFRDAVALHDWMYDIRFRCPLLRIGAPTDFRHDMHVTYDPTTEEITGLPEPWIDTLFSWGLGPRAPASHSAPGASPVPEPASAPARTNVPTPVGHARCPSTREPRAHTGRQRSASEAVAPLGREPSLVLSVEQFRKSPYRFRDVAARDLTGAVRPVHLLPTSRDENCDIWKAEWSGPFGTRKVAIQVIRLPKQISARRLDRVTSIFRREGPLPALVSTWLPRGNIMNYLKFNYPAAAKGFKLTLLKQVAAGLNYLHNFSRPIVHGDLRGAHILISDNGNACLAGYGINPILRELGDPPCDSKTAPFPCRWAAIEVLRTGLRGISPLSDVSSFARTVVEVMTGKDPYHYLADEAEVIHAVLRGVQPRRPPVFGEDGLWQLLERCWREEPTQRPSMALVLLRLEQALGVSEGPTTPHSAPP